ncbi:MAG: hypothetical protein ACRC62_03230 [Microcoleus sp.]
MTSFFVAGRVCMGIAGGLTIPARFRAGILESTSQLAETGFLQYQQ